MLYQVARLPAAPYRTTPAGDTKEQLFLPFSTGNAHALFGRKVDRVGFEPTASAMPMPYPTGLDDRPTNTGSGLQSILILKDRNRRCLLL